MLASTVLMFMFFAQESYSISHTPGILGYVLGFQKMCLCRCGMSRRYLENMRTSRLTGGELTSPHEFPWLVAINTSTNIVAGSLISDQHVVTAASPIYGTVSTRITVILGAHDRCSNGEAVLSSNVDSVAWHPSFTPTNTDNDIALIKLKYRVAFSQYIAPVCMPLFADYEEPGNVAWTVAWSNNNKNSCTPRVATLPMMPSLSCLKDLNDTKLFTPDKRCLGPFGSKSIICKTDVGAPVMSRWSTRSPFRLVGVISTSSCELNTPPLYTRIVDHAVWIYQHIRKDCQCF